MARDLSAFAERARQHQRELDLSTEYLRVQHLAKRWRIAPSTVRDIPRKELPYMEFGRGVKLKRRRYHPDDVVAYEERQGIHSAEHAA